jgi:hypothetical protein
MLTLPWLTYIAVSLVALAYFVCAKRRFDLFTVAFVGVAFYFFPLYYGYVIETRLTYVDIPTPIYWIGTIYTLALLAGAILADRYIPRISQSKPSRLSVLSPWYAGVAVTCLAIAIIQSRGSIINVDKLIVLQHVGLAYTGFEIAASLALLSGVIERRRSTIILGIVLLTFDLFVGFRFYAVFSALAVPVLAFRYEGRIVILRKWKTLGLGAVVFAFCIVLSHTARLAIFNLLDEHPIVDASKMRADTIQFQLLIGGPSSLPWWIIAPVRVVTSLEPFQTQSVLVETIRQEYVCDARNILKSVYLLVPPGLTRLVPNSYPPTFYDEYQPVLFPDLTYGLGGNVWAEMLCRFGYWGDAIIGLFLIATMAALGTLLRRSSDFAPPIALAGAIIGFYIHRNDVAYTLVMLRQVAIVFGAAYALSRFWPRLPNMPNNP